MHLTLVVPFVEHFQQISSFRDIFASKSSNSCFFRFVDEVLLLTYVFLSCVDAAFAGNYLQRVVAL